MSFKINRPVKRILAFSLLALLLIAVTVIITVACSRKAMLPEEAYRWIAAYTPAHIDQDSKIRIELTDLTLSKIDTTRSLDNALSFSPRVDGVARYSSDKRYIDFTPAESMKPGQNYRCALNLSRITAIDSLDDFTFDFHVDRRQMRFDDVVITVDPDDMSLICIKGRLAYNAAAGDSVSIDSTIIVCGNPDAEIVMDSTCAYLSRGFKVTGIRRGETDKKLTLSVNPISGFSCAPCDVVIPSDSDFRLLNAERIDASEPYVNLEFSAPLSSQQELDGLITIDNIISPRIVRSGTNVKVYYGIKSITELTLHISDLIKSTDGKSLDMEIEKNFKQEVIPPAIEIPFSGNILPDNRNLRLPFRAVNLAAVDVEVVKIFPSNVMAFLQKNDIDDTDELRRFGRLVYRKTVRLDNDKSLNLHQWQNFSIDLKDLFVRERGAVYSIRLTFRKAYSLYDRDKPDEFAEVEDITDEDKAIWDAHSPYIYRDVPDYDDVKYVWEEANDPSKESYYMVDWGRMPEVNLVASNLGLIVKRGNDGEIKAFVTDIVSANPASRIFVTAYNYQLQKIGFTLTDENGFADLKVDSRPFMVTASDGVSTTYLKITSGYELSTSNFDVSGTKHVDGIKGFVYGERGVWRPGDDIYLTLILEDKNNRMPDNHPVIMELYNPNDQLYDRQTLTNGTNGFYVFHVATDENAPTGLWTAKFKVGNETFTHPVRIETIKPNRLKININAPRIIRSDMKNRIGLTAHWLSGPAAKDMDASVEMTLYPDPTPFKNYRNYVFTNPLVSYTSSEKNIYSGRLDSTGHIVRDCRIGADMNSPGMFHANVTAKVAEPGGNTSISAKSVPFSPFEVYVGVNLGSKSFETDRNLIFPVVTVNQNGAKVKSRELNYKIYCIGWDWWWENGPNDLSRYVKSTTADVVANGTITAVNGVAEIPFKVEYPDYGRYLILVRDTKGGHAAGGIVTVDWPEWRGRSSKGVASGSTELSFVLDKRQYERGETAYVYMPKCDGGRVLLTVENGQDILRKMWVNLSADKETKHPVSVDESMTPNFYVSATLLRPHKETDFDTPIRLFGIQSAKVVNQQSILHPEIEMPDELHPQQTFTVKVSERDRKPMTYTLAIVDEGLLDITNFRTPRPWEAMNKKEALGVKTWDMFDDVIGAFGSNFRSIMSIGGDEALRKAAGKEKRFNPVVKFIGPFTTDGGSRSHRICLPNYIGSVRVMVVAAQNGSYGSADKTVKVSSPLMVLPSIPRNLANCDTLAVPANIFVSDKNLKDVTVNIDVAGPLSIIGAKSSKLKFREPGEQMTKFLVVCDRLKEDKGRIILTASCNGQIFRDTTCVEISNPMPNVIETAEKPLEAGKSIDFTWTQKQSGVVSLQVASMPMPIFSGIASYMESYRHLCSEQLSSKLLFMLYGRRFLASDSQIKCEKEIPLLIKTILLRQTSEGGFVYWPGELNENEWVTSMAGLALTEAARQGFRIDNGAYGKWLRYQEKKAHEYKYSFETDLNQAFRLYSMAVAAKPQISAMNRMRESKRLSQTAAYCLASAYSEAGRKDVAAKLIERAAGSKTSASSSMFSTTARDRAIELEALTLSGQKSKAFRTGRKVAKDYNAASYVTQDIAFATIAMNHLADIVGCSPISIKIAEMGQRPMSISDNACLREIGLNGRSGRVTVTNHNDKGVLDLSLSHSYKPEADAIIKPSAQGMTVYVSYTDTKGSPISVKQLKQGTDFKARIIVTNLGPDVDNMALSYSIPSGWEIWNDRLNKPSALNCDNCDIRDSSINYYFAMKRGETKTFEVRLRAAYLGNYLMPSTICEAMYNPACRAITASRRVIVKQ